MFKLFETSSGQMMTNSDKLAPAPAHAPTPHLKIIIFCSLY